MLDKIIHRGMDTIETTNRNKGMNKIEDIRNNNIKDTRDNKNEDIIKNEIGDINRRNKMEEETTMVE